MLPLSKLATQTTSIITTTATTTYHGNLIAPLQLLARLQLQHLLGSVNRRIAALLLPTLTTMLTTPLTTESITTITTMTKTSCQVSPDQSTMLASLSLKRLSLKRFVLIRRGCKDRTPGGCKIRLNADHSARMRSGPRSKLRPRWMIAKFCSRHWELLIHATVATVARTRSL